MTGGHNLIWNKLQCWLKTRNTEFCEAYFFEWSEKFNWDQTTVNFDTAFSSCFSEYIIQQQQ